MKNMRKYYSHVSQIVAKLTGVAPCRLSQEAQEMARLCFQAVISAFEIYCPEGRKNMISYPYVLSKVLFILGYDDLARQIHQVQGREKVARMDSVWRRITTHLDWPYYPSVVE